MSKDWERAKSLLHLILSCIQSLSKFVSLILFLFSQILLIPKNNTIGLWHPLRLIYNIYKPIFLHTYVIYIILSKEEIPLYLENEILQETWNFKDGDVSF